jgi:hypothetical protein
MIQLRATTWLPMLAFGLALAATGLAWGGAPGFYVAELVGLSNTTPPTTTNSYGGSLLPDGTVIGETYYQPSGVPPPLPVRYLSSWNSSGTRTDIYNCGVVNLENVFGDTSGRIAMSKLGYQGGVYIYSGGSLAAVPQLASNSLELTGMSQNGLAVGWFYSGTGFAYDAATSQYYTIGPTNSWVQGVNANGYAVGGDGTNFDGFVWKESDQSYTQFSGLAAAQGISNNNQLVAGLTQGSSPNAAVYTLSGTPVGTYWAGEATGINNNGVVIGDTAASVYMGGDASYWRGHAMAYFPGFNDPQGVDLNVYAPSGVTFNIAQAVNESGQILVWSNGWSNFTTNCKSYLLTPALPGDANLDHTVDIADLSVVLANYDKTGMAWSQGDFDGNGTVDISDLSKILANYDKTSGAAAAGIHAVPEPGALLLLAVGMAGLFVRASRARK